MSPRSLAIYFQLNLFLKSHQNHLVMTGYGAAPASLSPNPKNLYEVWQEYQVGIGGRKAAKLFTAKERGGKVKHKYHRRKAVWSMVSGLVRVGLTADTAIDQIYAVYGQQTSVTNIINGIKRDSKAGTHSESKS